MNPNAEPFLHRVRVYWEDTDAGGVVFYANYLKYFERARTEWLRSLGFSQQALKLEHGAMFIVTDTTVQYRAPARLDDAIDVSVVIQHVGAASMVIKQAACHVDDGRVLAQGTIRIGCVDAQSFRPRRIPTHLAESIT